MALASRASMPLRVGIPVEVARVVRRADLRPRRLDLLVVQGVRLTLANRTPSIRRSSIAAS